MPIVDESGHLIPNEGRHETDNLNEFIETLCELEELHPERPIFLTMLNYFGPQSTYGNVCPTAIGELEGYLLWLINLESFCQEYQRLPFDGGVLDQPQAAIEVFDIIRMVRNEYYRLRDEKMKESLRSKARE